MMAHFLHILGIIFNIAGYVLLGIFGIVAAIVVVIVIALALAESKGENPFQ